MKYIIVTFTFVNGKFFRTVQEIEETHSYLAALSLDWALDINIFDKTELDKMAIETDESGQPLIYLTRMPGYEKHPPTYLTIQSVPE